MTGREKRPGSWLGARQTTGYSLYPHSILSLMTIHEDDLKGVKPSSRVVPYPRGVCPDMLLFRVPIQGHPAHPFCHPVMNLYGISLFSPLSLMKLLYVDGRIYR
jgi:hypothetical protein